MELATGDAGIERGSAIIQNVDAQEEEGEREAPRNSAPTQARAY